MSAVTVSVAKFHGVVQAFSLYQPSKVKEAFVGSVGFAIVLPCSALIGATAEPSCASKVTVYVTGSAALNFTAAVKSLSTLTVTLVPDFVSPLTLKDSTAYPASGLAVKVTSVPFFTCSPDFNSLPSAFAVSVPCPPFTANVTVTVAGATGVHFAYNIMFAVTVSAAKFHGVV